MDFRKYFASISHAVLKAQLRRLFKDSQLLALFDKIIDSYETTAGCGIPIGNLTSQYFANYYLSAMDHYAKEALQIPVYIRYMDDILILENDKAKLKKDIAKLDQLANTLQLHFKPSILTKSEQGVSFLGYKLFPHKILLNSRSKKRYKEKLHRYNHLLARGLWDERTYQQHITPLIAFANWAYTKQYYISLPN